MAAQTSPAHLLPISLKAWAGTTVCLRRGMATVEERVASLEGRVPKTARSRTTPGAASSARAGRFRAN